MCSWRTRVLIVHRVNTCHSHTTDLLICQSRIQEERRYVCASDTQIHRLPAQVSYVLDTEDVFRRHRRQQQRVPPDAVTRRVGKFRSWQDAARAQQQRQQPQPPPHPQFQPMVAA